MKLALGTVQFGLNYGVANTTGRVSAEDALAVLRRARESGMDVLDTAVAYGDSELILGELGVRSWKIVSKLPPVPDDCGNVTLWVKEQTLASIKRLGVSQLYGLLLHRPSQLLESFGGALYEGLQAAKAEGLVTKIGVSVYAPSELTLLFAKHVFDLVQAPLSILDRSLVESGWAQKLKMAGVEIHARSAFLQGLLLMPADQRPSKFSPWAEVWSEWDRWLAEAGVSPLQACLRYVNGLACIDRVVIGVDSANQLNEIVKAVDGDLIGLPQFKPLQDTRLVTPASWNQL